MPCDGFHGHDTTPLDGEQYGGLTLTDHPRRRQNPLPRSAIACRKTKISVTVDPIHKSRVAKSQSYGGPAVARQDL